MDTVLSRQETSLWRDAYPSEIIYPELTEKIEVDVAVVGAGIAGLTTAYLLQQSGLRVAVLEKDTVGGGTTGRTTGKVTVQHGLRYAELQQRYGEESAYQYGQAQLAAVELIQSLIEIEQIECDWQRDDDYVFTTNSKTAESIRQEASVAARLQLPTVFTTETPLPFPVAGALKCTNQAKFHAQKYLLGLAKGVHNSQRGQVYEKSRAVGIRDGRPGRVRTPKGEVRATHIIVATHVPTFPLLARIGYGFLEYPTESFAIAGNFPGNLQGMYISPDRSHHSIQSIEIAGKSVLLVVGAGGNIPGLAGSREARFSELIRYGREHFNMGKITHRWSDMDYMAYDGLPLVGALYPWSKSVYTASGFQKWGLSGGTVAAQILHDVVMERQHPAARLFDSTRLRPILSLPRAVWGHIKTNRSGS